jgi:hemerythrin-like domain-containing protein
MTDDRHAPTGGNLLARHHADLDRRFEALLTRAQGGDGPSLRDEWTRFETELLRHLELEEEQILPRFAAQDPGEARAILDEHAEIRRALLELGLNLDLHLLRADVVQAFVSRLRQHAQREDRAFYPWATQHLPPEGWHTIAQGLGGHQDASVVARLRELGSRIM